MLQATIIQANDDDNTVAPIANNQIQYSPFVPAAVHEMVAYCHQHNITVTAYLRLGGLQDYDRAMAVAAVQQISD